LAENSAHLAFNKNANKSGLLAKFSAAIEHLKESGEYSKLVDKALANK
jgi:ABC-type amino acid transport substrate-binding protein